jgi:predicted nucleic acid-binding protein
MSGEAAVLCFIDTNIWFYSFVEQDDPVKSQKARALIRALKPAVSTQVINEVCANLLRKAHSSEDEIAEIVDSFYADYVVVPIAQPVLLSASKLRKRYSFAYWGSLIIASALGAGCGTLYSEDMQHGLIVNRRLKILNPFI